MQLRPVKLEYVRSVRDKKSAGVTRDLIIELLTQAHNVT